MNIFKWFKKKFQNFMISLSFALKRTEEQTLKQSGEANDVSIGAEQQITENRVSKALLKGEVTQEVQQLRYRTYKVDEEAKEHEYYSPLKSIKRDKQDNRHIKYKELEGCKLILIQPNTPQVESVYDSIKKYEEKDREPQEYTIRINRKFTPRFRIEEYTKRLVLFSRGEETVADFYISIYADPTEFKAKAFLREVKEVMNGRQTDLIDFKSFEFETYKCYNSEDYQLYKLKGCHLEGFDEYDGNYIFRFVTEKPVEVTNNRLSLKYYDDIMEKKYQNKEKKHTTIQFNPYDESERREYICASCGKKFYYDLGDIDAVEPGEARYIEDDNVSSENDVSTYLDMEMTEQATGKKLCKNCLQKEYEKLVAEMAKNKE